MIWDIDDLLKELGIELEWTLKELDEGREVRTRSTVGDDFLRVTTSVSIKTAVPDNAPLMQPVPPDQEPLVDVFEDRKGLRVVVELPGVRKEDVKASLRDGLLRIEVSKGRRIHRKDVPCKLPLGGVQVKSATENNSVVEITFLRKPQDGTK